MMKVKPFSYHIPRRKSFTIISRYYSRTYCSSSSCLTSSYKSVFSLCGTGTVVILVLVGFIGVAGQGKVSELDETSPFATQSHAHSLSHKSLDSISDLDPLAEVDDGSEDEALQRIISSMGQYGAKYSNNSFSNNYSSYPHHYHRSSTTSYLDDPQYKLENIGGVLLTTSESLSSLHDQRIKTDKSSETDGNTISQKSISFSRDKRRRRKEQDEQSDEDYAKADAYPGRDTFTQQNLASVENVTTRNQTSGEFLNATYYPVGKRLKSITRNNLKQYKAEGEDDDDMMNMKDVEEYRNIFPSYSTEDKGDDDDEYDGYDLLERFIPGNSTHLSGKHSFRQSSQAEVDGVVNSKESDGNSLLSSTSSRRRPRRSVVHLYDMVVCSTGCNPLIFKGYGCYCGFLGSGLTVDGIDKCCAKHDWCYHHAKCPPLLTYFVPYYWRCHHGRPQCVTDFRGWKGICGAHLCECDRQFAECLKKFPCPRSRAMCVTSPWSHWHPADPRTLPYGGRGRRPPRRIPLLPYPLGRIFPP